MGLERRKASSTSKLTSSSSRLRHPFSFLPSSRLSFRMQGFNKYYAPDFDPNKTSSLNAYHGKHALGDRARKVSFELPSFPSPFSLFLLLPWPSVSLEFLS